MSRYRLVSLLALVCVMSSLAGLAVAAQSGQPIIVKQGMAALSLPAPDTTELFHWSHLPVNIFIAAGNGQEQKWSQVVAAGFDEWVQASHGVVTYRLVDSASKAQITVRFVSSSTIPCCPNLVGLTTTSWTGPVLQSAEIVLATGQKSPSDLQTAAAHELGHALGICGHSDNPADLMFSAPIRVPASPARPVTDRDLDSLKRCYPALFAS
jgi:predicted Zn-dependent protease